MMQPSGPNLGFEKKVKLVVIAGARPNFMKIAPLLHALGFDADFETILIHTGQHYQHNMSGQFFEDLGIPAPHVHLEVGSGTHAAQTADIMKRLEPVLLEHEPTGLIVVGDVNSTVAGALVASKLGIRVVHVEAGLRSFDRSMPEEINRVVTDSISDLLLVTEQSGRDNLMREGVPAERIRMVGNLMIDTLRRNVEQAMRSDVRDRLGIGGQRFGLVTLHRPANVDNPGQLREILGALSVISETLPLWWPVHPRTAVQLRRENFGVPEKVHLAEPLGYLDFLCLQANAAVVLTDSGGIQEETTALGVPCLTLRDNTERPVTVTDGTNLLAGTRRDTILNAWEEFLRSPKSGRIPPMWDGRASDRCREALRSFFSLPGVSEHVCV